MPGKRYSEAERRRVEALIIEHSEMNSYELSELTGVSQKTIHLWGTTQNPERFRSSHKRSTGTVTPVHGKVVKVSARTYQRLAILAQGFETPNRVIELVLDFYDIHEGPANDLLRLRQIQKGGDPQ